VARARVSEPTVDHLAGLLHHVSTLFYLRLNRRIRQVTLLNVPG
jgi:hypothetical protein